MIQGFDIKLATHYSIEEAVIIDVLFWWILKNACNDDMIKDGKVWCYCSSKGLERYIPYMGWQKIRRILKKVEEDEILVTGNYNKRPTDQTLWYAFSDKGIEILEGYGYDFSKMKNGIFKNEKSNINNTSLINNIKNYKEEEKERLSNDNHKKIENGFDLFWETYGYKRDKKKSQRIWSKLNAADRKAALAAIPDYKRDCQEHRRQMRYPSVYLNNRTWEDEFTVQTDEEPTDEMPAGMTREKWMKIQEWMQERLPRIWKYIDVDAFLSMEGKSGGDRYLQRDIMLAIDRSTYEGDMVEEFERLRWTEEFKNRLPCLQ